MKPSIALMAVIAILFLSGCATNTHSVYTFYNEIEERWLVPCELVPPPDQAVYKAANANARAAMTAAAYSEQLKKASECSARIETIRNYNDQMKAANIKERYRFEEEQNKGNK